MQAADPRAAQPAVTIRDRRELPFFQVRLKAVQMIRDEVSGPRRLRTIGFYALLCQLANEQRHTGEHRRLQFTYDSLARRAGIAKSNLKLMLGLLERAGVVRYERLTDPQRGAIISILHLLIQDGAWTAITVAMADRLASERAGGHLLRDLGLVVVLLEFCVAQRDELGSLNAEVSRTEIACQAGLAIDRVDDCNRLLQAAGVLTITRRRSVNGGRNLASLYTIHEAPTTVDGGGQTELTGRQNRTGRAEDLNWQDGGLELTGRQNRTPSPEDLNWQSGNSATGWDETPPSNTRARSELEETAIENNPMRPEPRRNGGEGAFDPAEQLCLTFLKAWAPVLGDSPAQNYRVSQAQWQIAASRLLARHTPERLKRAFEQMLADEIVGSRALTMPAFEKVADQLIARHHARSQASRATWGQRPDDQRLRWPEAKQHLERAIQRHGRDHRDRALAELSARDELLVLFVERVRWSVLCEQPIKFVEGRYTELWSEIVREARPEREEPAA